MDTRVWIGVAFGAALVIFLMVAYFKARNITDGQLVILRFLSALCAGCMGASFAGEALFEASGKTGTGLDIVVSGTAGFALFLVVWFTTKRTILPADAFNYTPPGSSTFEENATAIAQADGAVVEFKNFTSKHLATEVRSQQLNCDDAADALRHLGKLAVSSLPKYTVTYDRPKYSLVAETE